MANPFDQFDAPSGQTADANPFDKFDDPNYKPEGKGIIGHTRDLGLAAARGAIAVPEIAVGAADLLSGGKAGKTLENQGGVLGFRPKQAKEFLSSFETDQTKAQRQEFASADGVLAKTGVALANPSLITNTITESAAPMLAGGLVGRGVKALGLTKTGATAAAIGEGATMAGSAAEQIRQQTDDGLLTGKQTALALGTGIVGTAVGAAGNKLGQAFGDVDSMIVDGAAKMAIPATTRSLPTRIAGSAAVEGAEELAQSVPEQVMQNAALGKPLGEGVEDAAVMGTLAGVAMGAGAGGVKALSERSVQVVPPQAAPAAEAPGPQPGPTEPGPQPGFPPDAPTPEPVAPTPQPSQQTGMPVPEAAPAAGPATQGGTPPQAGPSAAAQPAAQAGDVAPSAPAVQPGPSLMESALADAEASIARTRSEWAAAAEQQRAKRMAVVGVADPARNSPLTNAAIVAVDSGAHDLSVAAQAAAKPAGQVQAGPVANAAQQAMPAVAMRQTPALATPIAPVEQAQVAQVAQTPTPQERIAALSAEITSGLDAATGKPLNALQAGMRKAKMRQAITELPADQIEAVRAQYDPPTPAMRGEQPAPQPQGAPNESQADETIPQQAQPEAAAGAVAQPAAEVAPAPRPDTWRKNAIQAAAVARSVGINTKGMKPAEIVAAVERVDAARASGSTMLGQGNTPMAEGGQPFKTREQATKAKKLQPTMRVASVSGGFALIDKTPAQLVAEKKGAARLSNRSTSPRGEPIPAHAFIASMGGLHADTRKDMNIGDNPRVGAGHLFAGKGKPGLTIERATARLIEEGYLANGASHSEAMALIKRSLTSPQYTAEGYTRMAERDDEARRAAYMQQDEPQDAPQADPMDEYSMAYEDALDAQQVYDDNPELDQAKALGWQDSDFEGTGFNEADSALQREVMALSEMADAMGIDAESIRLDAHEATQNATTQDYYELTIATLEAAIEQQEAIARGGKNSRQDVRQQSRPTAAREGSAPEGVARPAQEVQATDSDAAQIASAVEYADRLGLTGSERSDAILSDMASAWSMTPDEVRDVAAVKDALRKKPGKKAKAAATNRFVEDVKRQAIEANREMEAQADAASTQDAPAPPNPNSIITKAKAANEKKAKAAELREFNANWQKARGSKGFDTWEEMDKFRTENRESLASASAALKEGNEGLRAEFAKFQEQREAARAQAAAPDTLTSPTPESIATQQERRDNADALDERAQIDREREAADQAGFLRTQAVPEQRTDNTGDMFGGPSADDFQAAASEKARKSATDSGPGLFDGAATAPAPKAEAKAAPPAPAPTPKPTKQKSAEKLRAEADLMNALADLGDIFNKPFRANLTDEQTQKLMPVMTRLLDAAFRLGYIKFKDAAKFALDKIQAAYGNEVADAITLDHLQGAYIGMAGGKAGADTKRAVIDIEDRAEITTHTPTNPAEDEAPTPSQTLTQSLAAAIEAGSMPKDNPSLKKLVEAFDGQPADQARMKQAQEELETAIAMTARKVVAKNEGDRSTFDALLRLYESQPNLNVRTSTSIANQAYSTPAPLAFLASRLAGIASATVAHEPTAGTGMLLIGADPKKAIVNELNDLRIDALKAQGFAPTQKDAATQRLVPEGAKVDAVVTNPPFGSIKDAAGKPIKVKVDGFSIGQIDHLIAARALETMKADGRATLIIGANKAPGGLNTDDRIFFNWLYSHYNVAAHFEVSGDLYTRQGAGWPVRVITINGRQKSGKFSPVAGTIQRADNWSEVYEQFTKSLGSAAKAPTPIEPAVTAGARAPAAFAAPARTGAGKPAGGAASAGNVAGASPRVVPDRAKPAAEPVGTSPDEQRLNAQPYVPQPQPGQDSAGATRPAQPAGAAALDAPQGNEFQTSYTPRSARKDEGVLIPFNMAQPTQDALSRLEDEVGDIDEFARKELGYGTVAELHSALMGLQVDSVATAIWQIKRGKAVVIADQTGIGKGRQAASIIRWAAKHGMTPVFVSVKPSLFTDMYGDLADIGTSDVTPFIMNGDAWIAGEGGAKLFANRPAGHKGVIQSIADSGRLPDGSNALFMTYSQINVPNTQRQALTALAPNAVFVLDESHNAAGASATGQFMIDMLGAARGVTYLSATYAKRPDNMPLYFKTDIGDAAADAEGLSSAMASGGLPLQTVVSNNLVKAGQMFRRERSYDGVSIASTFDTPNRALHERMSNEATKALRAIVSADRMFHEIFVKQLAKELAESGATAQDSAGNQLEAGVQHTEFSSVVHNFVKQMLLGLKAQTAADEAIASLRRGEKPIIAVENTMGSFLNEYAATNGIAQGDSLGAFDYRTVLTRALARSRVIIEVSPGGDKTKRPVSLGELDAQTRAAYEDAQNVIDGLTLSIPVSPIDWMRAEIVRSGFSVAEITGRNLSVDYSEPKKPVLAAIDPGEQKDKVNTTRQFNSGKLDALILNVAGSTGISLHASEKFDDQRQRHMIVAQAAGDINIFMQMLGRVHRTGQVRLPKYTILSVDLPTEKRPTAVLSVKMKSLNANTSSNTESATSVKSSDILNKYGDQIVSQYLSDNYALARALGLEQEIGGDDIQEDIARKATGRLALQPIEAQHAFYDDVEAQYNALIEYLNKTNQNDLEPRTFDFDAKETRQEVLFEGPDKSTPFGEDAIYGEYSIKAQGHPMKPEEIRAAMAENLAGMAPTAYTQKMLDELDEKYDAFHSKLEDAGKDGASAVRGIGRQFLKDHPIGSTFRVDINSEPFNAVILNVRNSHKQTGNPYSLSKMQLTVAINGALRSLTVPATQFKKIEVSTIAPFFKIGQLFKEQPPNQRETAKIVTGNLLAAYGELQGVRGTIITFTKQDGTSEQGILLPKAFDYSKNTRGDYRLATGASALKFLQASNNKDIGRFGIMSRDGNVRVLPAGRGVRVQVPKSKLKGGKFFLDNGLIAAGGDFVSSGNFMMQAVYEPTAAVKVLDLLMKKQALYALPSMAAEAKELTGDKAPAFSRSTARAPGMTPAQVQAIADRISAKWTNAPEIIVAANMADERIPQAARDEDQRQRAMGATGSPEGFVHEGAVYLLADNIPNATRAAEVLIHEALRHVGLAGVFGDSLKTILQQVATMRKADVTAKAKEYGLNMADPVQRLQAAEEVLAAMPESSLELGFVKRAIAAIRNWLRANVPGFKSLELTDADIVQAYLLPARGFVERGRAAGAGGSAAFSRGINESMTPSARAAREILDAIEQDDDYADYALRVVPGEFEGEINPGDILPVSQQWEDGNMTDEPLEGTSAARIRNPDEKSILEALRNLGALGKNGPNGYYFGDRVILVKGEVIDSGEDVGESIIENAEVVGIWKKPTKGMSEIQPNEFTTPNDDNAPMFSRGPAAAIGEAIKSTAVTDLKAKADNKLADYRGIALQLLGGRQLNDLYAKDLPQLNSYTSMVQQMSADANEVGAEADKVATAWGKLKDERKLAELMHDATIAQIDPDKPMTAPPAKGMGRESFNALSQVAEYRKLKARFDELSPESQAVYRSARDGYEAHYAQVREAIRDKIERSELAAPARAAMLKRMDDEFFGRVKGVYFPLARFGKYVVVTRQPGGEAISVGRAETLNEAEALRAEMRKAYPGMVVGKVIKDKEFNASRDAVGKGFLKDLFGVLDKAGVGDELQDAVNQLYLASMPDLSWAKHGIHRKGTPGFSQDARRAYAQNMFHGARHLAKLRYADQLQTKLEQMQEHVQAQEKNEAYDSVKAQQVVDELYKRHESLMNPRSSPLSTALTSIGFVFHLGLSPASAMVNLSQTALVAYPVMGAKWGFDKSAAELMKAAKQAAAGKNDISGALNFDERRAYDEAVRAGTIDVTNAHDLAGIAQGEDAGVMWKVRPVMRWASFMFHHAERFNRQITFVASYRLARAAGTAHEAAIEQATKATYDGHFDYAASNRPRFMQGNAAKVLLLFKQYGQNMVYTLARQAQLAISGETPAARTEARKALSGLLVMHAAAAGALGLPMVTTLLAAASMIGSDDDEPWDAKTALQNMLADTFGQKPAEVIAHGLSRLTPWDISGRVGLDRLIFPDLQEGLEGQRLGESFATAALGPVAGIGISVLKGLQEVSEGHFARGIETMMPAALRGPVKALRYKQEGVKDKTGIAIKDDVSLAGVLGQAVGFSPSEVRNATEGRSAIYSADKRLSERRAELMDQFAQAYMTKDEKAVAEARAAIKAFGEKHPSRRINAMQMMQSVRSRQNRIDRADGGVYLPKNRRDAMEAGRFAEAQP